uniref:Uncharacterized protein n=1 Tax=Anguilla anguilla TaxID=7936 RepID=A0A0E9X809_ANGAN
MGGDEKNNLPVIQPVLVVQQFDTRECGAD